MDTALILPVTPAVPGAVVVPERLAPSPGLFLWPRLRMPSGSVAVYVLTVLRPPEAPGRAVRSEPVYVGRTTDLGRRIEYHRARSGRRGRTKANPQRYIPPFDDVLYYIEEAEWAEAFEAALIKTLLPQGNKYHKTSALSGREQIALERWGLT